SQGDQHGLEHVPLSVAAAQAYHQIAGARPKPADLDEILNEVARALSNTAPIYIPSGTGVRQLAPIELIESKFQRGATLLRLHDGAELRGLTMRRIDVRAAVAVLKAVNARFGA